MVTNKLITLLPDLATFIVVVNEGSFTAATKKLGVTPSALSKLITRLESALSVKLFERSTRRLLITEPGKKIYQQSTIMVEVAQHALDISNLEHVVPSGTLTVAGPKAFMTNVIQPLVTLFLHQYPNIDLKLRASDGEIDIIEQGIDVVFRLTDKPTEGLILKEIGKVNLSLCASPEYLKQRGFPDDPLQLIDHDCLFLGETPTDHIWEFVKGAKSHVISVTGRYAVNHSQMRLNGVKDGFGIGIFPDFVIKDALKNELVIPVLSDWIIKGNYQGVIAMQYAQNKYMPTRLKVFTEFVKQHAVTG
ncbi:LysR family transcriptional regulator [Psychromonas sp. KJ10-10]|uniref:LysR family transcriptional regulator n=1 Tax=Psychromonas sp. KJ10-10 TaxID=3391823 RepID=UPI0039B4CA94